MRRNQQKALCIGTLFFLLLFGLSTTTLANPNYWSWGNTGAKYHCTPGTGSGTECTTYSNTIFSSNTPITVTNLTALSSPIGTVFSPIALDFNNDYYNEFVFFKTTEIVIADKNLVPVQYIALTDGTVCGNAAVFNLNQDETNEVAFITTNATGKYISYIYYSGGAYTRSAATRIYNTLTECTAFGGSGYPNNKMYAIGSGSVVEIDMLNGSNINYTNLIYDTPTLGSGYPYFNGGSATAGAINTVYNIYYIQSDEVNGHTSYISKFNPTTKAFTNTAIAVNAGSPIFILEFGSLGNSIYNPVLLLLQNHAGDYGEMSMYAATDLSTIIAIHHPSTIYGASNLQWGSGADINLDGSNEICITVSGTITTLRCYGVERTPIYNLTFPTWYNASGLIKQGSWAYMFNDTFMQYITEDYIFKKNSSTSLDLFINITDYFVNSNTFPMIVNVNTIASSVEQKSIIFSGAIYQHVLLAEGIPGYCGNLICEWNETIFNCPTDCVFAVPTNGTASSGTVPNFAYCDNSTWCLSGSCIQNLCSPIEAGQTCVQDAQCRSQDCDVNFHCTQPGFTKTVQDFIGELFGFGFFDKLFIGLLLIIIMAIMGTLIGSALNFAAAIACGCFGMLLGLMLSVFVFQFIPVWFFVILLFAVVGLVFMIIFLGRSGG